MAGGVITVTTSYAYDQIGRTTSSTQDGTTIQYEYDKAGNITLLSQPTEGDTTTEDTTYEYNGYGQLEYVYQNGELIREYNYLTTGQTDTMVDYLKFDESNTTQTMTTSYQYTALGQVEEIKYVNDNTSATMEKYTYTYDKRGNILTEYIYNTYGGTTSLTKSYVYNSMNMLGVAEELDRITLRRGYPQKIRVDNGPEFISKALDAWAYHNGVKLDFSRPGKPTDNAYIESFNGSLRDECLNTNWFLSIEDARDKLKAWQNDYNEYRPHSSLNNLTPAEYAARAG